MKPSIALFIGSFGAFAPPVKKFVLTGEHQPFSQGEKGKMKFPPEICDKNTVSVAGFPTANNRVLL